MTVTSLAKVRLEKDFDALVKVATDPHGLFDIPFGDILHGVDSNESKSDPIALGPQALIAVKRLFAEFGIEEMPANWGQLVGAYWYCKVVYMSRAMPIGRPEANEIWEQSVMRKLEGNNPELVASVQAYNAKDTEALRRIAKKRMTLDEMCRHYDAEDGWRGTPLLEEREQLRTRRLRPTETLLPNNCRRGNFSCANNCLAAIPHLQTTGVVRKISISTSHSPLNAMLFIAISLNFRGEVPASGRDFVNASAAVGTARCARGVRPSLRFIEKQNEAAT